VAEDKPVLNPPTKLDVDLSTKADDKAAKTDDPRQGLPTTVRLQENQPAYDYSKTTKGTDPRGKYVRYNGVGTVRIMGPKEWKAAGVKSDDYFEWNVLNKKRIPLSSFSDEQLQYLLRVDGRFELVEDKPETKG